MLGEVSGCDNSTSHGKARTGRYTNCCINLSPGNLMRRLGVAHKAADRAVETGEKHLPWLSWEARLRIAAQLACVIRDLHARGVLHHDLKPENMLLDSCGTAPSIRLTDFGT